MPKKSVPDFFGSVRGGAGVPRAFPSWLPWVAIALATTVASCASLPAPDSASASELIQARRAALQSIARWDLRGRVGVRLPDEGAQASLRWRHGDDGEQIDLTGPFGGGHARLQFDAHGARLTDARGREHHDADAEALLLRATGWQVPLGGLTYWIRGLPIPGVASAEEIDAYGRLRLLRQLGWDIEFLAYDRVGAHQLPSKLFLARRLPEHAAANDNARIEVRLVVNSWDIGAP